MAVTHKLRDQGGQQSFKLNRNFKDITDQIDAAFAAKWAIWRIKKPRVEIDSSDNNVVKVSASSTAPVYLSIGDALYTVSSDLSCDISKSGIGGLESSATLSANTNYYLYAVVDDSSTARLILDENGPETGVAGISDWTYLRCVRTDGSNNIFPFMAAGDVTLFGKGADESRADVLVTSGSAGTYTALTVDKPSTVDVVKVVVSGVMTTAAIDETLPVISLDGTNTYWLGTIGKETTVATISDYRNVDIPIHDASDRIWYKVLSNPASWYVDIWVHGWYEDPTRWK